MKDDRFYLLHIRDALADLRAYASPGREAFLAERLRQDGIIRKLEVVGEAVKGISAESRARCPEIPWRQIAGMRDKIGHEYFGVNLDLIWMVIERDLPALEQAVSLLLGNADDDTSAGNP